MKEKPLFFNEFYLNNYLKIRAALTSLLSYNIYYIDINKNKL